MLKFISKTSYGSIICCLLSGCYHFGNTSLHIKNNASSQLITNNDRILITTNHPIFEDFGIYKNLKARTQSHLIERGYSVVDKNTSIKPNLFVLIEPNFKLQSFQGAQLVCEARFIEMSDIRVGDSNNTYTTCYNQNHTTNTYVYDYSLTIYHPKSICNDINQCIDSKNYKQNAIFSSHISYKIEKAESSNLTYDQIYAKIDDKIYQKMTDAIFATFPLNQNSLVYFQNTPDGYVATQIIKE